MTVTPNVFLIGAPKCGTTAMMQYLGEHPNVFTSVPKEPFYWCPDFARSRHEPKFDGLDDYLALFAEADPAQHKVVMEGSTRYLQSVEAIPAILAFNPQARFIAMVRDPVEVAQAYHMEQRFSLHEDVEDFRTAWNLQDQRAAGQQIPATCGEPKLLQYREVAAFGEQVTRAAALIPEGQFLVIDFEDFKTDTGGQYRRVLAFLGLDDDGRSEFPVANGAHGHRSGLVARLLLHPPKPLENAVLAFRSYLREKRPPWVERVKALLNRPEKRAELDPAFRDELQRYFSEDQIRLQAAMASMNSSS